MNVKFQIGSNIDNLIRLISKEELFLLKKNNKDCSRLRCIDAGEGGHFWHKSNLGVYTPRNGYYKIIEIPNEAISAKSGVLQKSNLQTNSALQVNTSNGDDRILEMPLYAYYDFNTPTNFLEEIVLIEGRPLYNSQSIGPKNAELQEGLIVHVISASVIGGAYKIEWELI